MFYSMNDAPNITEIDQKLNKRHTSHKSAVGRDEKIFFISNWVQNMFRGSGAQNIPPNRSLARKLLLGGF